MVKSVANNTGVARWKVICDWLRAELPRFEYGSDFYTARQICERFGVSSITATRSLNELASEGLIEKIQGKGNVVRQMPRQVSLWMVVAAGHEGRNFTFDNVHARRMEGIRSAVRQHGGEVGLISETHLQSLFPREDASFGFFVLNPVGSDVVEFLSAHDMAYVLVDPYKGYEGLPHARLDRFAVGYEAVRHLLELGHRRIAWVTTGSKYSNFTDRIKGYRRALSEAGISYDPKLITDAIDPRDGSIGASSCEMALDRLLRLKHPPTAIITCDDTRVIHLLDVCRRRGIDVPGRLSVLGHPDYSESTLTTPPLSVVDGCYEKVGEMAVRLLLDQMSGKAQAAEQAALIRPALVERASTGPAPNRKGRGGRLAAAHGVADRSSL